MSPTKNPLSICNKILEMVNIIAVITTKITNITRIPSRIISMLKIMMITIRIIKGWLKDRGWHLLLSCHGHYV